MTKTAAPSNMAAPNPIDDAPLAVSFPGATVEAPGLAGVVAPPVAPPAGGAPAGALGSAAGAFSSARSTSSCLFMLLNRKLSRFQFKFPNQSDLPLRFSRFSIHIESDEGHDHGTHQQSLEHLHLYSAIDSNFSAI
jgi:hypothetical protein